MTNKTIKIREKDGYIIYYIDSQENTFEYDVAYKLKEHILETILKPFLRGKIQEAKSPSLSQFRSYLHSQEELTCR